MNISEKICISILSLMVSITFLLTISSQEDIEKTEQTISEINSTLVTTASTSVNTTVTEIITTTEETVTEITYLAEMPIEIETEVQCDIYTVPEYNTSFKAYMDYRKITDTTTKQWSLQQQCWTDEHGIRRFNTDYCVAMGSGYANEIGDRFQITLDNGETFVVIVSEFKADKDTDDSCRYYEINEDMINILEFIVDENKLINKIKITGTVGTYPHLSGNIIKIEGVQD